MEPQKTTQVRRLELWAEIRNEYLADIVEVHGEDGDPTLDRLGQDACLLTWLFARWMT
jgi:hypothetical protein